jgi:hypothetical protein
MLFRVLMVCGRGVCGILLVLVFSGLFFGVVVVAANYRLLKKTAIK